METSAVLINFYPLDVSLHFVGLIDLKSSNERKNRKKFHSVLKSQDTMSSQSSCRSSEWVVVLFICNQREQLFN